jgi:hypothetical protein
MDFPVCIANIAPSTSRSSCNITAKTCPITPNTRGDLPGRQILRHILSNVYDKRVGQKSYPSKDKLT